MTTGDDVMRMTSCEYRFGRLLMFCHCTYTHSLFLCLRPDRCVASNRTNTITQSLRIKVDRRVNPRVLVGQRALDLTTWTWSWIRTRTWTEIFSIRPIRISITSDFVHFEFRLPTPYVRRPTFDFRLPTFDSRLPTLDHPQSDGLE